MNSDNLHHQDSSPISTWAIPTARPFQVSVIAPHDQETSGQECNQRKMTINMLSNDVLMEIFDFYANGCDARINEWHTLLHVCRRWRYTVFAFPRHLNLRMEYVGQGRRYISEMLDAWPVLPLVMTCRDWEPLRRIHSSCAKIISALESRHHDRICEICFYDIPEPHLKNVVAAMWRPFPELRRLRLGGDNVVAAIPNSFLGGSAPCLRELEVDWIGFRGMKNLLLSANNLVTLSLWSIPDTGYIPPVTMATCLFALPRLNVFKLGFLSPLFSPSERPYPLIRSALPALTTLAFQGAHKYLEDLVAQFDTPLLDDLVIIFFDPVFDTPQLYQLIYRTQGFKVLNRATVFLDIDEIELSLDPELGAVCQDPRLKFEIQFHDSYLQLPSLPRLCRSSVPLLPSLKRLDIDETIFFSDSELNEDWESAQWLEILDPFSAVKDLYLSSGVALQDVCRALDGLPVEQVTKVLPALQNIFLRQSPHSESIYELLKHFIEARRLSGHPVAVHRWNWQ